MSELENMRSKIDDIDSEMVALLLKRLDLAREIAAEKRRLGLPAYDEKREDEIIASAIAAAGDRGDCAKSLMNVVLGLSKAYQASDNK